MKYYSSSDWLETAWRRRKAAGWAAAAVFAVILLGTVLYPPLYESTAQILVQSNRAHYVLSPALQSANDPNAPVVDDRVVSEQDLNSEIELITQLRVIEQALADLTGQAPARGVFASALAGLLGLPGAISALLHDSPRPSALQRRALAIQNHLGAIVLRKSNMLEVSYQSHDAVWSRQFLTALLNRYFQLHTEMVHDARSEQFFDTQIRRLREKLDQAEERLRAVRERTGILSLPDQSEAIVYQLSGFQAEYRKNQSRLDGINHQVVALETGLKASPMRLLKEVKTAPNPAYQSLRPKVLGLALNRNDVLERYRPASKMARQLTAESAAAQVLLDRENHTEVVEQLSDLNPVWLGLAANLAQARVTAAALAGSQSSLARQIDAYQVELRRLTDHGVEVEQALREVEADNEAYLSYLRKGEQARAELELNESRLMNVEVAMPPSQPLEPKFPKFALNLSAGLLLALFAGLAAAWWEEHQDPTIYSVTAIAESCSDPVVAVLGSRVKGGSVRA